ncbi:MAG: hypothetical protein AAGC77_14245 [Pseudomonadota bacterium]
MGQKSAGRETAEQHAKNIRRATRKKYSTEEKLRIVLSGLGGRHTTAYRSSINYSKSDNPQKTPTIYKKSELA